MLLRLNSAVKKLAVLLPLGWLSVIAGWTVVRQFVAERYIASGPTAENYQRATIWDESNSLYHFYLARLFLYGDEVAKPLPAIASYRRAIALSPLVAGYWLDLGNAYEAAQRASEAEHAFSVAARLNARSPQVHWEVANFWLRRGNLDKAFAHFKAVAEFNENRIGPIMSLCWKVMADHERILRQVIPDTAPANLSFLNFALERKDYTAAARAWGRLMEDTAPSFQAASAFPYIDALMQAGQVSEAGRVWHQAMVKGGLPAEPGGRTTDANRIYNGGFESNLLNGGFDWRALSGDGFSIALDLEDRFKDSRALRIDFDGKTNLDFLHLYQIVPLAPACDSPPSTASLGRVVSGGRRHVAALAGPRTLTFSYWIKTQDITTDQGLFWEIFAYPRYQTALVRSKLHLGTAAWARYTFEFTVEPNLTSLMIRLRRLPSHKLDNRLRGRVWLDDVTLYERPAAPSYRG